MARKNRVWYPGAMYHITSRGNRRGALFYDHEDHLMYLELLEETRRRYPFHLHAYCLMTNHIHLQLETIDHHLQHIMKKLNFRYAIYFNKRHNYVGHAFQGRYGAEIIETKEYQLETNRYIHLNPVEANMVISPEDYRWSSYSTYVTNIDNPHVTTEKMLNYFPEPVKCNYRKFVKEGVVLKNNREM